jgi:uncharacterized protein (TIGR00304 family)
MDPPMRMTRWLGPAALGIGLVVLALAVGRGEATVYLVFVVPVLAGTGPLAFLGILLVFVGFFLTFLLWSTRTPAGSVEQGVSTAPAETAPPVRRWGGIAFLGPIPLVFGSDPRMTRTMLWVGVALFLALLALTLVALLV